jgi:phosphatidylglycerol:prolipoprotein diacylglycerol transferase
MFRTMHPWLVNAGPVQIPTWFTCLMLGLALATFVLRRESLRRGMDPRIAMDCALWVLPAALIGARLAHVVIEAPGFYLHHPVAILSPNGGWVFYGGLGGALIAGWSYARHSGRSLPELADLFAPATAFGLVFGRIGCLGGGCCYGRSATWPLGVEVPWSIRYFLRGQVPEAMLAVPVHPAPLYEALGCIALFVGLSSLAARQRFAGEVLLAFVAGYGVLRTAVEVFRADDVRGMWLGGWLSTSQIVGLVTAALAAFAWRRQRCTPSSPPSSASPSTGTGSSGR